MEGRIDCRKVLITGWRLGQGEGECVALPAPALSIASVEDTGYVNSMRPWLSVLCMHSYYILFAHVAKSINWPRTR